MVGQEKGKLLKWKSTQKQLQRQFILQTYVKSHGIQSHGASNITAHFKHEQFKQNIIIVN